MCSHSGRLPSSSENQSHCPFRQDAGTSLELRQRLKSGQEDAMSLPLPFCQDVAVEPHPRLVQLSAQRVSGQRPSDNAAGVLVSCLGERKKEGPPAGERLGRDWQGLEARRESQD